MERKRRVELSYLNLLYCVLVVLIHICSEPVSSLTRGTLAYYGVMIPWRLSAFVVPGFIFLSGLKLMLNLKEPFDTVTFWCKRIKSIVLPYLLWVSIYYCYFVSIGYFPFRFRDLFRYMLIGDLSSHFYFVVIIVQFYLLAPLFIWATKRLKPAVLLLGSFVLMLILWRGLVPSLRITGISENFLYTDRVFTSYLFYFVFGCVVGKYYDAFLAWLRRFGILILAVFAGLAALNVLSYAKIAVFGATFVDVYHHAVYAIGGILCTFYLADLITRRAGNKIPKLFAVADRATYLIYLSHTLAIIRLNYRLTLIGITALDARLAIRVVFVYCASFGTCMLWGAFKRWFDRRIARRG